MSSFRNYFSLAIGAVLLSSINVWGQTAPSHNNCHIGNGEGCHPRSMSSRAACAGCW